MTSSFYFLLQFYFNPKTELISLWLFVFSVAIFMLNTFAKALVHFLSFTTLILVTVSIRYEEINFNLGSDDYIDMFPFAYLIFTLILFVGEYSRIPLIK